MFRKVLQAEINSFKESVNDLRYSWKLFKENAKAFLSTEIFAIVSSLVFFALLITVLVILDIRDLDQNMLIIGTLIGLLLIVTVFNIFLTTQYGLAYDIYSSGDMFAEFKGIFQYFKKSWWRYLIVIIIFNILTPASFISFGVGNPRDNLMTLSLFESILYLFADYLVFSIFVNILPGISNHNNLRLAIGENFALLKRHPKRIFTTWAIFYLIFELPVLIFRGFDIFSGKSEVHTSGQIFIAIPIILLIIFTEAIRFPIAALVSTRMYNLLDHHPNGGNEN